MDNFKFWNQFLVPTKHFPKSTWFTSLPHKISYSVLTELIFFLNNELILEKNTYIFPYFYFCIGSKITETVNYVIILGGIMGKRQQQQKNVKMQHYKFLFIRFVLDFCFFLGRIEGQGPVGFS